MLTPGQIAHFETFGFLVLRKVFTADEMATIKRESDEIFSEGLGNTLPHGRVALQPFFERRPFMARLLDDDRIYGIGEDLLGPDFLWWGSDGNLYVGDTAWHADTETPEDLPWVKVAIYLDPLTKDDGCLRVIPGTHRDMDPDPYASLRRPVSNPDFRPFGVAPSDIPSFAIESRPGDVVVFTEHVLHASFGGAPGRHQHAINFAENPKTEEQVEYIKGLYESMTYSFHPSESYINSERPRIRRMVAKLAELGFEPLPF